MNAFLHGKPKEESKFLRFIYKQYKPLVRYILTSQYSADPEEVEDIFQDTIFDFYVKATRREFGREFSIKSFIVMVAKRKWFDRLDHQKVQERYEEEEQRKSRANPTPEFHLISQEKKRLFNTVLNRLNVTCRKLLAYKWFHKYRMEEICDKLGLSSEQVTRNKHVRCKRELEKLIQANPEVKNAILEII